MELLPVGARLRSSARRLLLVVVTTVLGLGAFTPLASATTSVAPASKAAVAAAASAAPESESGPATGGYQLVAADGGIFSFGDATFYGSAGALPLAKPIVGMAPTVSGHGYWLVASDGGVFSFGSAAFHGSTGALPLAKPIVGMAPTPSGHGYWLVASDGGVFAFGDAVFEGSAGALPLAKPIVGMSASPTGNGYWLVASDGGIFSFGDAPYFGSAGALPLTKPIVGMSAPASGDGYWLVASDGGIFSFGNAGFYGSAGALTLTKPIVGIAHTPSNHGYWLVASDGGIFSFGDATYFGSTGALALNKPVVGMQATQAAPPPPLPPVVPSATQLSFSVQPGNSTGGTNFTANPTVQIQDATGATVTSAANDVNLHLTTAGGSTLACSSNDVTAASGVATFTGCNINRPGTYTLTATSGALTSAVSSSSTITVGPPAKLGITAQPSASTVSSAAFAAQPAVTVQDAGGNTITGNTSNVTLAMTTPSAAVLACTANPKAAVAGVATFAGCNVNLVGAYTLTATDGALTSAVTSSVTITPGVATHLGFAAQPSGASSGTVFATQPSVSILDAAGNVATANTSNVTLALTTPGGAALLCTANPKAAVAGVATFTNCSVDLVGTYTLTATDGALTSTASTSFPITAGGASRLAFTTQPGGSTSSTAFGAQPAVAIRDAAGNPVTTDTSSVSLTLTSAGGAALACTVNPKAAVAGVATFAGCKVDLAGTYTLTASDGGLTSATSSTFTITAGAATGLTFTTQPSASSVSSTDFAAQPVVTVHDAANNTVLTDNSTALALQLTTPGGASLSCGAPVTATAGVATFTGCHVNIVGTYTLTATGPPLPSTVSTSFTITPGTATQLAFTTQPSDAVAGAAFSSQPVVTIRDAAGNTTTGNTSSVTLALTTPAGATLACTANPKAAVAGVATFAGCNVNLANSYTLSAEDGALTGATGGSFAISAGAASSMVLVTAPTGGATGSAWTVQPVLKFVDSFGNTATSSTDAASIQVLFGPTATNGVECASNPQAAVAGVVNFADCTINTVSAPPSSWTIEFTSALGVIDSSVSES